MTFIKNTKIQEPLTPFGEIRINERTPLIELESFYGISNLRDTIYENGVLLPSARSSTLVTNNFDSYNLTTTTSGTSSVTLESTERGRYMAGYDAEVGIGLIFKKPTSTSVVKWGYFDDNDGFYFKRNSSGYSICRLKGGVEIDNIDRINWDDPLDGSGKSGVTLDPSEGYIWQIEYVHYGYGPIYFIVHVVDSSGTQKRIIAHTISEPSATSVNDPNLPIRVSIDNAGSTQSETVVVTGRQFSVGGKYRPSFRTTSHFTLGASVSTTFSPIMSFRRKLDYRSVRILPEGYGLLSSSNVLLQFVVNGELTGASYGNLNNTNPAETALEVDTSATALNGGEKIYSSLHAGTSKGNDVILGEGSLSGIVVPALAPITIMARTVSGTGTIDVVDFKMLEEW